MHDPSVARSDHIGPPLLRKARIALLTVLDRLGGDARTLVVGDRVDTDLSAAAAAGLDAALVLSGGTDRQALNGFEPEPVAVTDTLADLLLSQGG